MWASKTCYSKLHGADRFQKSLCAASINGTALAKHFLNFCHDKQISALVEIGSNDSCLKKIAEDNAFKIATYEYMPSHSEASHFDLISLDTRQAKNAKATIANIWGNQEYVTTCFNVLEHIDIEDIHTAIFNLFDFSNDFLIVSIFTRPSIHGNSPHSTILPISTWKHLFEIVGFEVLDDKFANEGQDVVTTRNDDPSSLLATQWTKADIFRNRSAQEPNYLLLRKVNSSDRLWAREEIDRVLDIAYRKIKRTQFIMPQSEIIGFNIHHIQDFFNIRPLLDVIDRKACIVLLREGVLKNDEEQLVTGFFFRCGVMLVKYKQVAEINWHELMINTLISAAESTAAVNHALSSQIVEAAKLNGVRTILLQHGIWIQAMRDRQISFSSDYVLSWGREHETFFKRAGHLVAGVTTKIGNVSSEFIAAGSPKFYDSLISPNVDVLRWRLGIEQQKFSKIVLVGTNLKWSAHKVPVSEVTSGIRTIIEKNEDILFLVKPHPSERNYEYEDLKFANSIVLDDITLGCIDLSISRLLGGVSTVVSSLSTLILDGAVSGKRCIQYYTGNSLRYEGCTPFDIPSVNNLLRDENIASLDGKDFKNRYNDAENSNFYKVFLNTILKHKSVKSSFENYSMLKLVEDGWLALNK